MKLALLAYLICFFRSSLGFDWITCFIVTAVFLVVLYRLSNKVLIFVFLTHAITFVSSHYMYINSHADYRSAIRSIDYGVKLEYVKEAQGGFKKAIFINPLNLRAWKYYLACSLFLHKDFNPEIPLVLFFYDGDIQMLTAIYFARHKEYERAQNQFSQAESLGYDELLMKEMDYVRSGGPGY